MTLNSIIQALEKNKGKGTRQSSDDGYINSGHYYYDISVPVRRGIAKNWLKNNKGISLSDFFSVIDGLYAGKSHDEKSIASILLGYNKPARLGVKLDQLDKWLNHLVGWSEIDSICQNVFTYEELLSDWKGWNSFIKNLASDKNINKRRASIVLLTGPVAYSDDDRIKDLALEVIEKLKDEKPIIITKAVSWLLRSMIKNHRKVVADYIKNNMETLPKIAVRETLRKLKTGRK